MTLFPLSSVLKQNKQMILINLGLTLQRCIAGDMLCWFPDTVWKCCGIAAMVKGLSNHLGG